MLFFFITALVVLPSIVILGNCLVNPFLQFMQCRLCDSVRLEGLISDCSCDFGSVDKSVTKFFSPVLENITSRTFFRYFRVNLEEQCPFWQEDGQCMMESCSVCTCEDSEVPRTWVDESSHRDVTQQKNSNKLMNGDSFGWISSPSSSFGFAGNGHSDVLGRLNMNASSVKVSGANGDSYLKYLRDTEDDDNGWTDMSEDSVTSKQKPSPWGWGASEGSPYEVADRKVPVHYPTAGSPMDSYVNLLQNPEQFTGYSGPSAARVWQSIQHENCFGGLDDTCVEKRVFYRLMSGLQASISTHIAREYFYPDGRWDTNIPLFVKAVGSHPDRLSNLYFTFLFVLRAVTKAGTVLTEYPFHTGNRADDEMVRTLIRRLVKARPPGSSKDFFPKASVKVSANGTDNGVERVGYRKELDQCRKGFDESVLFQVPPHLSHGDSQYTQGKLEKQELREEFRTRFRNITRIMDCVTCEKCKVWGKLQILGLGTAIKILLTPEKELRESAGFLNRQEVIALINTLHQLTKSVSFAAHAADLELSSKVRDCGWKAGYAACSIIILLIFLYVRRRSSRRNSPAAEVAPI